MTICLRAPRLLLLTCGLSACIAAPLKLSTDDSATVLAGLTLDAPNPAERGPLGVKRLYYGSGNDKRRAEFRDSVAIKTASVDGSKLAGPPNPQQGKVRKEYWGFDFAKLPVNGRVWYPDGAGPYPLVLVVHGNHNMKEFSDPGYEYLGQLLASRGFILASIDENFLNGFMRQENDARGWMLLQHLKAWRGFADSADSPLRGKVDMGNIALMGHSRGGEAVAVAGLFNRLSHYPDDASVRFDFHFNIKSLVAIAPVDGQYRPTGQGTPLTDYNYLLMHGSHDGDVSAFSGLTQYERLQFSGRGEYFKSAFFVYRANHGQWNTVWGSTDGGERSRRFLDLRGFISQAEQRRFAELVISAFLEATLKGKSEYLPVFRDYRVAGQWFPKTMYTTRFQESSFVPLVDFDEDVDVTTGRAGVTLSGDSLSTWKEGRVPFRYQNADMAHNAVTLGWNNRIAGPDTARRATPAAYTLSLSDSARRRVALGARSALTFSLAPLDATPGPRSAPKDTTTKRDTTKKAPKPPPPPKIPPDSTPVNLTLVFTDSAGQNAMLALDPYGVARRPLEANVYRRAGRDKRAFASTKEVVLQTFTIPLSDAQRVNPSFDAARLTRISWRFDRTVAATVMLDNIGIATPRPEFFVARRGGQ